MLGQSEKAAPNVETHREIDERLEIRISTSELLRCKNNISKVDIGASGIFRAKEAFEIDIGAASMMKQYIAQRQPSMEKINATRRKIFLETRRERYFSSEKLKNPMILR